DHEGKPHWQTPSVPSPAFWIDELGHPGMELLDLAQVQMHEIIAGPFEDEQIAKKMLRYVVRARYLGEGESEPIGNPPQLPP
ncbi:MAG: hypothetical protein Q7S65_04295, partial [Nanoarchaeota archaeon]|nr:hypothetical protein [Nanoarchaeota archaeon]